MSKDQEISPEVNSSSLAASDEVSEPHREHWWSMARVRNHINVCEEPVGDKKMHVICM